MKGKNILTISSQVKPYLEDTSISEMSYQIPKAINELGGQIRIFMPRFGVINQRRYQLHEVIRLSGVNLVINDTDMPLIIKVASIPKERIQVYFIDNDDYFKRKAVLKDDKGRLFKDSDERAMFFAKGVIETIKKLNWAPDIIHIHGWLSALVPLYLRRLYRKETLFKNSKIITSIYDETFDGYLSDKMHKKLIMDGFDSGDVNPLEKPSFINLMRTAIDHSDALLITSKDINKEINQHIIASKIPSQEFISYKESKSDCMDFFRTLLPKD